MIIRFKYKCSIRIRFFSSLDFGFNGIHCCNSCGDGGGGGFDDVIGVADDGNLADMNHDGMIHNTSLFDDVDYNHGYRNNVHVP